MTKPLDSLALHRAAVRDTALSRLAKSRCALDAAVTAHERAIDQLRRAEAEREAFCRAGTADRLTSWSSALAVCDAWLATERERAAARAHELHRAEHQWIEDRRALSANELAAARLAEWRGWLQRQAMRHRAAMQASEADDAQGKGLQGPALRGASIGRPE